MESKWHILGSAVVLVGALAPSEEIRIACLCVLGSVLGAYIAVFLEDKVYVKLSGSRPQHFAVNCFAGIIAAPIFVDFLHVKFPHVNVAFLSVATGGLSGILAVSALCLLLPWAIELAKKTILKK